MPRIKFTPMTIKHLKPSEKVVEYFEEGHGKGEGSFGLRVNPSGIKTWFIMYWSRDGKRKRYTLGRYPALSLKQAREKAKKYFYEISEGKDPQNKKIQYRKSETLNDLWDAYLESPRATDKAPVTLREERRKYEKHIRATIGSLKLQDIERRDISRILQQVASTGPINANRLYALLSMLFNMAVSHGWIPYSPMAGMQKPGGAERPRQRVLSDQEIKSLWPILPDYFKMILLTGQRPGEVYAMHSRDIDFQGALWIIPAVQTKTGFANAVPLSQQAIRLIPEREGYCFPSTKGNGHIKWTNKVRERIQQKAGIYGWTAHDLRRTARTMLSRLGVPSHVSERVLGHKMGGIEGVYDTYDYLKEKRQALDKLGREIDRILGIKHETAVISIRQ